MLPLLRIIALVVLLNGCTEPPKTLRVGTNTWPGYETLYLARELGYLEDTSIKLVEMPSATEVMNAFRDGNLEAAALTLDEAISLCEDEIDTVSILVFDVSDGADSVMAKPSIKSLADIKGKRIAVEHTAVGAIMLQSLIDAANLSLSDIEVQSCRLDQHVSCYESSDLVVTFEPVKSKLAELGAHDIFNSQDIPNTILDVLVVKKEHLEMYEDELEALVKSYFDGLDYLKTNTQDAHQIIGTRLNMPEHLVAEMYDGLLLPDINSNHEYLAGPNGDLKNIASHLSELMHSYGLSENKAKTTHSGNPTFLPSKQ